MIILLGLSTGLFFGLWLLAVKENIKLEKEYEDLRRQIRKQEQEFRKEFFRDLDAKAVKATNPPKSKTKKSEECSVGDSINVDPYPIPVPSASSHYTPSDSFSGHGGSFSGGGASDSWSSSSSDSSSSSSDSGGSSSGD